VNFAIDRRALAQDTGIGLSGRPTDQYIPPSIPGFEDAAIYPLGNPDVAAARRLTGGEHHDATLYTCNFAGCVRNAQILRANMRAIGINVDVREFPLGEMFARISRPGEPWDIAYTNWFVDYADPFDYINNQFGPGADHPGSFRDPRMDQRMAAVAELSGNARLRGYAKLDRDLAQNAAPAAAFATGEFSYLVSPRTGCVVVHPIYGLDLGALCMRS
jgi:ABC-type transport system substrate-binding protein